jgi:hypothetical protein
MLEREHVTDALGFWERGRILYNAVLAAIALGILLWAQAEAAEWLFLAPQLFVLAVAANALYCLAYPIDLMVQASDHRARWRKLRWLLWAVGMATAAVLASFVSLGMTAPE